MGFNLEDTTELVLAANAGTVNLAAINGKGPTGPQGAPGGSDAAFAGYLNDTTPSATRLAALDLVADQAGVANGLASLDSAGKVPVTQLPSAIMAYQGTWNASTNTPTLADGVGDPGDVYRVTVGATRNLGSGNITFDVGDYVIYNPAGVWEKSDTTDAVASVAGKTGVVTLAASDIASGTLPVARGGTNGTATPTNGGIAYGDGSSFAFTAAGTSGQILRSNGAGAPTWTAPPSGGAPLAVTSYEPSSVVTYTWASGNTDMDATNLAVTFTVPASGKVVLYLEAVFGNASSGGQSAQWSARDTGGTTLASTVIGVASVASVLRTRVALHIAGLTPGVSQTLRWGRLGSAGSAFNMYAGGSTSPRYGPAIMEVWAA